MFLIGKSKYITIVALIADLLLIIISFYLAYYICFQDIFIVLNDYFLLLLLLEIMWFSIALKYDLYQIPRIVYIDRVVYSYLKAILLFMISSITLIFFIFSYDFSRKFIGLTIVFFCFFLIFWKIGLIGFVKKYRSRGYNFKNIVLVGFNENNEKIIEKILVNPSFGMKIMGLFTDAKLITYCSIFFKGNLDKVILYCENNHVDELLVSLPSYKSNFIKKLLVYGENNLIRVTIVPEFSEYLSQLFIMDYFDDIPILKIRKEPLERLANKIIKRVFDIIFSWLIIIFVLSWLFPLLAIIIKLTSKGPVLFTQMRSGKNGRSFKCYKFRTMYINSDSELIQASKNDSRITKVGKFLRKTSFDELPQFFNVIKRNMSVVGPRPHMIKHTNDYKKVIDKFMVRHYAKPGITGWAQIRGFRGETKKLEDMEHRAKADIWYIENWNIFLDLKIIILTIWQIFFKKEENAY